MPQVFNISDRICVMRHGQVIKELKTEDTSMDEVVSMITGAAGI
jgi:ABC-type sugar transport system ATPase subunit